MKPWSKHPYGAAIVLVGLWLVLLAGYYGTHVWLDTYPHGDEPTWLDWLDGTLENLQSEAWQVAIAAWVFKHFFWKGSPEAQDQ